MFFKGGPRFLLSGIQIGNFRGVIQFSNNHTSVPISLTFLQLNNVCRFTHFQVSYLMFILLYGYVITMFFPRFDSSQTLGGLSVVEVILYFWIFSIIAEEIRQVSFLKKEVSCVLD